MIKQEILSMLMNHGLVYIPREFTDHFRAGQDLVSEGIAEVDSTTTMTICLRPAGR